MTQDSNQTWWMIRRPDLRVLRPIPQSELIQRISSGEVAPNDELCPANGYWFMLSEVNEVRKFLGDINLSSLHSKDIDDSTSSMDSTRPIQKTQILSKGCESQSAPVQRPKLQPAEGMASQSAGNSELSEAILRAKRKKNALGVGLAFLVFIVILVLFWLGSY